MKLKLTIISFVVTLCLGCGSRSVEGDYDFSRSYYAPRYATGFELLESADSTALMLKIKRPWQGAVTNDHHLIILRDSMAKAPTDFSGAVLRKPAKRVICVSSCNVAMLDAVDEVSRVVGVSGFEYITNADIRRRKVKDIGYGANLNFEVILGLRPDLVLLYGVSGEETSVTGKFKELGIPYIYIGDYAEQNALGKSEWLVALSEIVGVGERGRKVFDGIEQRYNDAKAIAAKATERPTVMLNTPYKDVWYMPPVDGYMLRLIHDAGGESIYKQNTTSTAQAISIETAFGLVMKTDFWINIGAMTTSLAQLKAENPKFASMPVVERGDVYNNTARNTPQGGSDFWESGVVKPDLVLRDLIRILHPELLPEHELYYYKQLK